MNKRVHIMRHCRMMCMFSYEGGGGDLGRW